MSPPRLPTMTGRGSTSVPVARCTPSVQRVRRLPAFANPTWMRHVDARWPYAVGPARRHGLRPARELVHSRGEVANDTVNPALDAGLSVSDVLEVVGECTFAGLVGTIDNLAGRVELDVPAAAGLAGRLRRIPIDGLREADWFWQGAAQGAAPTRRPIESGSSCPEPIRRSAAERSGTRVRPRLSCPSPPRRWP